MNIQHIEGEAPKSLSAKDLISRVLNDLSSLKGLVPLETLLSKGGVEFGRKIENTLNLLSDSHEPMKLQLRNTDKAVVIGVDQYRAIVDLLESMPNLVEIVREIDLENESNEFDQLMKRISSPASRRAADALFEASEDELNSSYKG